MSGSLALGQIGGIEIRIHPSWLVIFALVAFSLATAYFPAELPGSSAGTHWLLGVVAALLLFVSVLLHELSHSFVARARGLGVHSITLFIFGGVSSLEDEPQQPVAEFLIAVVGPLTSFVLGGLCFVINASVGAAFPAAAAVLGYLTVINLLLGLFNLVPGFPLDGGRLLRSIVWHITGSLSRATQIAGGIGVLVGYGFIFFGVVQVLGGNLLGGIWIAVIGWFLSNAAEASGRQVTLEQQLAGITVRDVMRTRPVIISPNASLQELVEDYLLRLNLRAVPVVHPTGRLLGLVTLGDLSQVPRADWERTPVAAVLAGRSQPEVIGPNVPLTRALQIMAGGGLDRLPVVFDGALVGMLSRSDVVRYLEIRQATMPPGWQRKTASG